MIQIEWQPVPNSNESANNDTKLFPRLKDNGIVDTDTLCKLAAKNAIHSSGDIYAALCHIANAIGECLTEGKTVELKDIGTFRLAIGTNADVYRSTRRREDKIEVRGINFQASNEMLKMIGKPQFNWAATPASRKPITVEELEAKVREYLSTHEYLTHSDLETIFHLKHSTAGLRLKQLVEKGVLKVIGYNTSTKYVLK